MKKQLTAIIAINALLIALFIFSNFDIWAQLNKYNLASYTHWSPMTIQLSFIGINGTTVMQNYPFWLFFISTAVNVYFIATFARTKQKRRLFGNAFVDS